MTETTTAEHTFPDEAAEGYIAAVAEALATAGYTLPSALPYALHPGVPHPEGRINATITVLDALPGEGDLALVWGPTVGWWAGRVSGGDAEQLTELWLSIVPEPNHVARAVTAIVKAGGDLEAGISGDAPTCPLELVLTYQPGGAELVKLAADAMLAVSVRRQGQPVRPATPGGWVYQHVRPVVALFLQREADHRARAEKAEIGAANAWAFSERIVETHVRFGVLGETETRCADWCHVCRVERAEAEAERLAKRVAEMERDSAALAALRAAGVDNWDCYGIAMAELDEGDDRG